MKPSSGMRVSLVIAALAASSAYAASPHPLFKVDPNWPKQLPHGYIFGPSGGVTVDSHDNVWVYSRPTTVRETLNNPPDEENGIPAPAVVELSPDGRFIQGWGGVLDMSESERAGFDWPVQEHGIAVDTHGNVWVCGNGRDAKTGKDDDQCLKFTNRGKFLMQIGRSGKSKGSLDTENLGHPSQPVYWPKANELFVSDGYANRRIYVADADSGKFKRMWGAYGNKPDDSAPRDRAYDPPPQQFNLLHGMTISKDGIVYVADRNSNRLQAFTLDGRFLKEGWVARRSPQRDFGTSFGVALSGDKAQKFLYVPTAITRRSASSTGRRLRKYRVRRSVMPGLTRASSSTFTSSPAIRKAISISGTVAGGFRSSSIRACRDSRQSLLQALRCTNGLEWAPRIAVVERFGFLATANG